MRSRSAATWFLVTVAVLFAVANVAVTVHRSLIPVGLDGVVESIEVREEKHPGVDDVWLVSVGGRRVHADAGIASQLAEGERVDKARWDRRLRVDGTAMPLRLSSDATGMLWVMPVVLLALAAVWWAGRQAR